MTVRTCWRGVLFVIAAVALALPLAVQAPSAPAQERATSPPSAHHFEPSIRVRDALVRGDLVVARRAARELARAGAPISLRGLWLDVMHSAAREVESARDVGAAAHGLGTVARTCGECHREMGADVRMSEAPVPPRDDVAARTRHHAWATDRLWEGLVLEDAERYAAGAAALLDAPLVDDRARERAREAQRARDGAQRARAYGALLGTCAECHRTIGAL
ncbi:hypothetical protein [Sandaracinus amylolyticus]|uniref:hypothetical protein n=1 Tax=Sandaracinus amylolyticus TaxID=927083 RepID=UPI001F27CD72|nr:hypothetical protein [Sandaracinus amylolyticus]UJR84111.1 Hypothetical protein I5071_61820 [Sandaracinus amylolyticus]